jgi:hypothetical protein
MNANRPRTLLMSALGNDPLNLLAISGRKTRKTAAGCPDLDVIEQGVLKRLCRSTGRGQAKTSFGSCKPSMMPSPPSQ